MSIKTTHVFAKDGTYMEKSHVQIKSSDGLITLQNDGPDIVGTNYFDSEFADSGLFFLSANAGVGKQPGNTG